MIAILKFKLPEENDEYRDAIHGTSAACIIDEVLQKTRGWLKYGHTFKNADEAIEEIRRMVYDEIQESSLKVTDM